MKGVVNVGSISRFPVDNRNNQATVALKAVDVLHFFFSETESTIQHLSFHCWNKNIYTKRMLNVFLKSNIFPFSSILLGVTDFGMAITPR